MDVLDLFPRCQDEKCSQFGRHKHPLAHQQAFLDSGEKYVALVGGVGSGKSLPAAAMGVLLSISIPNNLGIVLRRTYRFLEETSLRMYMEVLDRSGVDWSPKENRDDFPHRIVFPNGSEILFRESKNPGRYLGPSYGWFHIEEAQEEPRSTFTGLSQRLRLPQAGRYLRGFLTTNPPNERHWIAEFFGTEPGTKERPDPINPKRTTKYRLIRSATGQNPHLPEGYLGDMLSTLSPQEIRRVVEGNFGFSPEGPPVFPPFQTIKHVGEPAYAGASLIRSWDFGFRHPACTWHQRQRCKKGTLHWHVLAELDSPTTETEVFAQRVVDQTRKMFPTAAALVLDCGDAAGAQVNERGPGPIIRLSRPPHSIRFKYRKLHSVDPGLELMRRFMERGVCACGEAALTVHRRCRHTIDALAGGYHYPENKPSTEKPIKDGFYDDFVDTVRYAGENFIRPELSPRDLPDETQPRVVSPGAWLDSEPTEAQMIAEIQRVKEQMRRR